MTRPASLVPPVLPNEMNQARAWACAHFEGDAPPFSFLYGGQAAAGLLGRWKCQATRRKLDRQRTQRVLTYTDPATGLEIRCQAVVYRDFPVVPGGVLMGKGLRVETTTAPAALVFSYQRENDAP